MSKRIRTREGNATRQNIAMPSPFVAFVGRSSSIELCVCVCVLLDQVVETLTAGHYYLLSWNMTRFQRLHPRKKELHARNDGCVWDLLRRTGVPRSNDDDSFRD
jgi:hypothetical protein